MRWRVMAARRIDAIRLTLERYETQLREEEMQKLAAEAELKALRAQINPHFLFNALTTIGYLIDTAPARAVDTLLRLTHLLRGMLRPEGEFTTLGRELELVEHYLDIERERFEERLRVRIDVPADSACRGHPVAGGAAAGRERHQAWRGAEHRRRRRRGRGRARGSGERTAPAHRREQHRVRRWSAAFAAAASTSGWTTSRAG